MLTSVRFSDRVPDQHLFEAAVLSCSFASAALDQRRRLPSTSESGAENEVERIEFGRALSFAGGVTAEWLSARVAEWTTMIVDYQNQVRRARRKALGDATGIVH